MATLHKMGTIMHIKLWVSVRMAGFKKVSFVKWLVDEMTKWLVHEMTKWLVHEMNCSGNALLTKCPAHEDEMSEIWNDRL